MESFEELKQQIIKELLEIKNKHSLILLKNKYLGKDSLIAQQMSKLKDLSIEEKREKSPFLNKTQQELENLFKEKLNSFNDQNIVDPFLTISKKQGKQHIITKTIQEVKAILMQMDFEFFEGPEIENEFRNFTALNVGEKHPCRDDHQSFFLDNSMLLRTHTSNTQTYILENNNKDIAGFSIGRVYRRDHDRTHTPMFHQIEAVKVNSKANLPNLLATIRTFLEIFFEKKNIELNFRPSFFPFTEPSIEIDMEWNGRMLEIMGAGLIHPNVFVQNNSTPRLGFAFGMGVERIAMIKHGINDIRQIYTNNAFIAQQTGGK